MIPRHGAFLFPGMPHPGDGASPLLVSRYADLYNVTLIAFRDATRRCGAEVQVRKKRGILV
jgi:hypothetical protein